MPGTRTSKINFLKTTEQTNKTNRDQQPIFSELNRIQDT